MEKITQLRLRIAILEDQLATTRLGVSHQDRIRERIKWLQNKVRIIELFRDFPFDYAAQRCFDEGLITEETYAACLEDRVRP